MFTKKLFNLKIFLVFFILLLAFGVRFYHFERRINFGPEQAISLIVSADYLKVKPSLLGEPNVQRVTSLGHRIFHPPLFNYSLVPLLFLFNYNPIPITAFFGFLNLLTGLVLFWAVKKTLNFEMALFSLVLFLFNATMINHSLFIWNQNYIPILNVFIFLALYQIFKTRNKTTLGKSALIGFLAGLCFGIEFLYLFMAALVFFLLLWWSPKKLSAIVFYALGFAVAISPMLLFDLKHDFYFARTLWQYLVDTVNNPTQGGLAYYHFFPFWPLAALIGGWFLFYVYQKSKILSFLILAVYLISSLLSPKVNFQEALGMSKGLTLGKINQAANLIAKDKPDNFNVAMLLDFDSQAHPLRYFLRFKYGLKPEDVEQYTNLKALYVLVDANYDFNKAIAYEIKAYRPFTVNVLEKIDERYSVFKLTKVDEDKN